MRQDRCETCRFWDRSMVAEAGPVDDTTDLEFAELESLGYCKRFPPTLCGSLLARSTDKRLAEEDGTHLIDVADATCSPMTALDDWCGEWREKPRS